MATFFPKSNKLSPLRTRIKTLILKKRFSRYKHSSLFVRTVSDEAKKKFYKTDAGLNETNPSARNDKLERFINKKL
jgi:hypothetical protein